MSSPESAQQQGKHSAIEAQGCLHVQFEALARSQPDAIAAQCGPTTISYADLNKQANQLAHRLIAAGITPNTTVGLCADRSIELLVGIFGILKAGGAYVPLDPSYPPDRLAHILDQAQPPIIVTTDAASTALPNNQAQLVSATQSAEPEDNPNLDIAPNQLCYVIFTSGTTGTPKGVMVSHANVVRLFPVLAEQLQFSPDDVWTLFHSYAFGFSAWEIFGALLTGGRLVIVPDDIRANPDALFELLRDSNVSIFSQTPSAFRQVCLHESFANSDKELSLRLVVFSGEAVVAADLNAWFEQHSVGPRLINTYAITETGGQVALREYHSSNIDTKSSGNIGQPLADTDVYILDEQLNPVAQGTAGELCIGGPGLSQGYLNQPDLTADRFVSVELNGNARKIYRSGDQAQLLANGDIVFLGRNDGQIKLRGYRIELGDIESALTNIGEIKEAAVTLYDSGGSDPRLVAYLVATDNNPPSISELRTALEASLPDYMVPAVYVWLDGLPLNVNGKLDRQALPAPSQQRPNLATQYRPPESELEAALVEIWSNALSIAPIGVDDNFFELGGDSILALKLTSSVGALLGEHIYIVSLMEAPNVADYAKRLTADFPERVNNLNRSATATTVPATRELPTVTPRYKDRYELFPLTDIQQAYLVGRGSDFALGGVSTHLYIEVDAVDLDLPRLESAWQKVITRHPMLRAIILPDGTQQILPEVPLYRFPTQDLSNLDAKGVDAGLEQERERLSHQVIPSDRWPLFELSASLLPNNKTRIHISLDCLITDARSFQIMSGELLTFYRDADAQLPLPNLTFRDYVLAEREIHSSQFYTRALGYWQNRLQTLPPMPQLPLENQPETLDDHKFVQRGHELPKADWERFQARAARAGITPTAALLQCFGEALAVWSRASRLTLNLTLFNRLPLHPDVDDVVGDFTSLLLLGVDELDMGNFEQRASRLQKELWQGVDNRYVSGVQVLRELAQMGDKVQPMMPVVFTSTLGIGSSGQDSSSWHHLGEQVYSVSQTPQVWIDHVVSERDGALWFTWDVIEELFPAGLIDDLFTAYTHWLTQLARENSAWDYDWLTTQQQLFPAAQSAQREAINNTANPIPSGLLHDGFITAAAQNPDAPAVISTERTLTYGELDSLSNQLAHQLRDAKVKPNQLVAVVMQKGWEQVVAVLGILKAGAAYLPIDASMPSERLHYLLDFGEVKVAVTQRCQDAAIEWPGNVQRFSVSDSDLQIASASPLPGENPATATDIAYVIFTSGSTGLPKGVVIDHRGALNTCVDINTRFKVTTKDRVFALSSLSFDLSVYDIFGVLAAGGAVVMPDASGTRDPSHWATLVAQHRVTIWNTVPALMGLLTEYAEQQAEPIIDSLRVVMMSGDWIPVKLPDRIRALCDKADINSLGGATEASIWSIIYPISNVPAEWTSIPYGKPMVNQTFHVLNADLQPCPNLVPGELYIGGIGVAKGYWRDTEKTAASFIEHPETGERLYRTGDLGRYLADGNIEFLGREDFQVKIQGFRVELGDIEAALENQPQVQNAVVIASGPERGEKRLIGYFVRNNTGAVDSNLLRTWLADKLPAYMVPSVFVELEKLPLSSNGKVDRKQLPEPATVEQTSPTAPAATSEAADLITQLVGEVLGGAQIDQQENLLQMGATSIEMIRIANAMDQQFGFRPRMDDFYREPTIAGLTHLLDAQQPQSSATSTAPAGGDPLATPDWVLADIDRILDPEERAAFKDNRPGIRRFDAATTRVNLDHPGNTMADYIRHRSYREFSTSPIPIADLTAALSKLRSRDIDGKPKYLYASAGGLYPVQAYLYIKESRCADLDSGSYYFDPAANELVQLEPGNDDIRNLYDPIINRPIFDQAAFAIYLVVDLAAIGSMYPERALHYATLEAGHMTQLLEMSAPDYNIGLCQIGGLETEDFARLLQLESQHLLLHGLLGGGLPEEDTVIMPVDSASTDRDEGEL